MKKTLLIALSAAAISFASETALVTYQLQSTTNLSGGWKDEGQEIHFAADTTEQQKFFRVKTEVTIMKKPIYQFEKRTESTDASEAALQGSVYWYDTGTEVNSEIVYYDASDTYALWYDGVTWLISRDSDVGSSPTDSFVCAPATITASGAGDASVNITYSLSGTLNNRPDYTTGGFPFFWSKANSRWTIIGSSSTYINTSDTFVPPETGWTVLSGDAPAPTLSYTIPTAQFTAQGDWTGTITLSDYTISTAWYDAETTCFDSLVAFLGATEGTNAFRGWIPINEDGNYNAANVWEIRTGSSASGYDVDRLKGTGASWCNAFINGEIHGVFESRMIAQYFAGSVMAWLKSTDNINESGNVTWCQLADLPESPTELIVNAGAHSYLYWEVRMPIEILYLTEGVHA